MPPRTRKQQQDGEQPAEPRVRRLVATHGVEFGHHPEFESVEKPGPYVTWAKFERDPSLDTPEGAKGYAFETDDDEVAERLLALKEYGIREVEPAAEADDSDNDE